MHKLTLVLALVFLVFKGYTQQNTPANNDQVTNRKPHLNISILPLYLYSKAIKFDTELQFKDINHGIILSTEIYNGLTEDASNQLFGGNSEATDKITGWGIGLAYKYKFSKEDNTSFYISPGLTVRKLNIRAESEDFIPYTKDNLLYYKYGNIDKYYKLNGLLLSATMGYQKVWKPGILLDLYMGIGHKFSSKNEQLNKIRDYTKYAYNYGFNGPVFLIGFKIGFQIF